MKTKTPESEREVSMEPCLIRLLREHKMASPFKGDDDFVFTARNGAPMHYRNVSRRGLDQAVSEAGLDLGDVAKLSFHNLRHTFACIRIAEGWDVVRLSDDVGHTKPSTTLDVYGNKRFRRARENGAREELLEATLAAALDGKDLESSASGLGRTRADKVAWLSQTSG